MRYHLTTFGCQMNDHDSERMKGLLEGLGYAEAGARDDADLILFNTCTIRGSADERFLGNLGDAKRVKRERPDAVGTALRALRSRDRTTAELDARLRERGVAEHDRHDALESLARAGYVDDERFAHGRAAALARLLVIPFAVSYTAFTTFSGITVGEFVREAGTLSPAEQLLADTLIGRVSHGSVADWIWYVAIAFWLAVVLSIIVALRGRVPLPGLVLMAIGAVAFARSHVSPWGAIGMAAFFAGVVWVELRPRAARLSSDTPLGYDRDDGRRSPDTP